MTAPRYDDCISECRCIETCCDYGYMDGGTFCRGLRRSPRRAVARASAGSWAQGRAANPRRAGVVGDKEGDDV